MTQLFWFLIGAATGINLATAFFLLMTRKRGKP